MDSRIIYCIYREVGPLTTGVDTGKLYITIPVLDISYLVLSIFYNRPSYLPLYSMDMDQIYYIMYNTVSEYPPVFSRTVRGEIGSGNIFASLTNW